MSENLQGSEPQPTVPPPGAGKPPPAEAPEISLGKSSAPPTSETPPAEPTPSGQAPPVAAEPKAVSWDDDWRAHLAGEDEAALNELSRVKDPKELAQLLVKQKKELSKRATSGAFPADGDDATQAAWREANNVPKEGTLTAYGVKAPDGYEMSEVETAALTEYAESMHALNASPEYVKASADHFFKMQEANQQAMNAMNAEVEEGWDNQLTKDFGKDRDVIVGAAEAYLKERVPDQTQLAALLGAQLPGGGTLGMNPEFIKIVADQAMKYGLNDRIEANSMEAASGKSLTDERSDLMRLIETDQAAYDRAQPRIQKLNQLLSSRGDI